MAEKPLTVIWQQRVGSHFQFMLQGENMPVRTQRPCLNLDKDMKQKQNQNSRRTGVGENMSSHGCQVAASVM